VLTTFALPPPHDASFAQMLYRSIIDKSQMPEYSKPRQAIEQDIEQQRRRQEREDDDTPPSRRG
jgi:hypothetical protein